MASQTFAFLMALNLLVEFNCLNFSVLSLQMERLVLQFDLERQRWSVYYYLLTIPVISLPRDLFFLQGDRTYGNCLITYELIPPETEAVFERLIEAWDSRQAERAKAERERNLSAPLIAPPIPRHVESKAGDAANLVEAAAVPISNSPLPGDGQEEEEGVEGTSEDNNSIYAPKGLCLLSKYPFVDSSRAWLMQVRTKGSHTT